MKISVIIIHWNNRELLEQQLVLLSSGKELELIVVDNASTESLSSLTKKFSNVQFIQNTLNRGFAFACNQGRRVASGEWLLYLNPDVVIEAAQIKRMVEYAQVNHFAAVSPRFGSLDYQKPVPSWLSVLTEFSPLGKLIPLAGLGQRTLVGGCLLIQSQILEEIHGWDERFFLWFEDSDLSARLIDSGYTYGFIDDESIQHLGGTSFSQLGDQEKRDIFFHSLQMYADKHFSSFGKSFVNIISRRYTKKRLLVSDQNVSASIVVPNMKCELLEDFLKKNIKFFIFNCQELIIVTSCENYESLRTTYPEVIFIYQAKNRGFAHTVNVGLHRARGRVLGTINDDVLLNSQWLTRIENEFSHTQDIGSVTPIVRKVDGTVESFGVNVLPFGRADVKTDVQTSTESATFNAAAVVFSREALEHVGLFDEGFESYLEDIDLGMRLNRNGWRNVAISTSEITHFGQQTSRSLNAHKNWLDVKNWWLVMLKNYSFSHWLTNLGPILLERARNFSGYLKALN